MGENANDRFERLAAEFYAATGMMAPGKDQPGAMGGASYGERAAAWMQWTSERNAALERDAARWRYIRASLDVEEDPDAIDEGPGRPTRAACYLTASIDETVLCLEGTDRTVEEIVDAAIIFAAKEDAESEAVDDDGPFFLAFGHDGTTGGNDDPNG